MLLATATPVQINPIERWDLLNVLDPKDSTQGDRPHFVLGNVFSKWRDAAWSLNLVTGRMPVPADLDQVWEWARNPLPPKAEHPDFLNLRRSLGLEDREAIASGDSFGKLRPPDQSRLRNLAQRFFREHNPFISNRRKAYQGDSLGQRFFREHNPFIRHIVRRTRKYLEETRDASGEPYLKPIEVRLHGEGDTEAIKLPAYLEEAYRAAEDFTKLLSERLRSMGFLKTMLLRRLGSSIEAGRLSAERLLGTVECVDEEEDDAADGVEPVAASEFARNLTPQERGALKHLVAALEANQERDPKYAVVRDCLIRRRWLERGCIIFSQYYDSIHWLAESLAAELPGVPIGIYSGANRSGLIREGQYRRTTREQLKQMVRT